MGGNSKTNVQKRRSLLVLLENSAYNPIITVSTGMIAAFSFVETAIPLKMLASNPQSFIFVLGDRMLWSVITRQAHIKLITLKKIAGISNITCLPRVYTNGWVRKTIAETIPPTRPLNKLINWRLKD